jgi:hypothetical protein
MTLAGTGAARVPGFACGGGMADYPRREWAVPIAQGATDLIRLLQAQVGDIDARFMIADCVKVFNRAIMAVNSVPAGQAQQELERLVFDEGLTVEAALDRIGC